jgi:hypothetical protein
MGLLLCYPFKSALSTSFKNFIIGKIFFDHHIVKGDCHFRNSPF